jgi:long-chain fatty acid transport protein
MRIRFKYFSIALVALTFPASVWATNGYFTHGVSTAEKGLAGAGVAFSQDTLAAGNNPAGMVWQGARYDIGAALFAPMREYSSEGGPAPGCFGPGACPFSIGDGDQSIDSENELFLIPQFGYNWELDSNSTIGVSVFGNGGMNTEYKGGVASLEDVFTPAFGTTVELPGTFANGTAGVDLAQLFISTTYAAKISETTSWGVSGIIAYQRFEAKGLANFGGFSTDPGNLTNNSHDTATGIGVRLGIQTEISPGIRFGAAYQPEIDMSEFDDYAGLFAEEGDFNIPSNLTVGIAVDIGKNGVLVVDLQQINYEDVPAVSNPIDPLTPTDTSCMPGLMGGTGDGCLGGDDGAGFGWEDMQVLKIGYQWQDGDMTWRVGYSTGDQPIPSSEVVFNILAPGVVEEHITFGFTKQIDTKSSFNFAAMYAPSVSVDGTSTFDPTQEIELEMDQYELSFTYNRSL